MPKNVAIIENDEVVNLIVCPDDWADDQWDGAEAIEVQGHIGPGWRRQQGVLEPPAREALFTDLGEVTQGGVAQLTYVNTTAEAPGSIRFDIDGVVTEVPLSKGKATFEIIPSERGEIQASVNRPVDPVSIQVS